MKKCLVLIAFLSLIGFQAGCESADKESPETTLQNQRVIDVNLKAAQQGDCEAMFNIARASDNGQGIDKSNSEAIDWYRQAAKAGSFRAMDALKKMCDIEWVAPESLILMLSNRGPEQQILAIQTMAKIKDQRFIEPLIGVLQTDDSKVVKETVQALKKITGKNFGKDNVKWTQWLEKKQKEKQPQVLTPAADVTLRASG